MSSILPFRRIDRPAAKSNAATFEDDSGYKFEDKPAAKSGTSVLVAQGDNISCPQCGCRKAVLRKADCRCSCHRNWNF
jgi:hypothetical protein